ncbi:MAG: hypothetical protein J0I20_34045 [Chloroflexi bacterium]|nr:hypothetical protein [Chloroflexota bacterium]OJW05582.1 MAG: hypothetical protein BGO39_02915 [Chloroflexi bacterium 54-19]
MAGSKGDAYENTVLDTALGNGSPASLYWALVQEFTGDGTFTEASGGSYARVAQTNNSTNFPAASGGSKSNGTTVTFVQATADIAADPNRIHGWALMDASSGGNARYWGEFVGTAKVFVVKASTDIFTSIGHGYTNGTKVRVWSAGPALPSGIAQFTTYYIINATTDTFQFSATSGGSAVDVTADGGGLIATDLAQEYRLGNTFVIGAGSVTISED